MKVFISWSGDKSKDVAILINTWLKSVLQATKPWVSIDGIDKGKRWLHEINTALNEVSCGIICLTRENLHKPWILFEAGSLASRPEEKVRVFTFLIDFAFAGDVPYPLAQFQSTSPEKEDIRSLIYSLNNLLDSALKVDKEPLDMTFDSMWPNFESKFQKILLQKSESTNIKARSNEEKMDEILATTRQLLNSPRHEFGSSHLLSESSRRLLYNVQIDFTKDPNSLENFKRALKYIRGFEKYSFQPNDEDGLLWTLEVTYLLPNSTTDPFVEKITELATIAFPDTTFVMTKV